MDVKPGPSEDLYSEVKTKGAQVVITDKSLMTFTSGNVAVVAERLMPVDARYGLAEVAGLKQLALAQTNVANATLLPKGGVEGSAIVFGAPGASTTKEPLSAERLARLAAVLTDSNVAHVVNVKHNSTSATLELPVGQSLKVSAQGGPLGISLIQASPSSGAPEAFYFQTTLPSGQTEQSSDIGLWTVNFSEASAAQLHQTLKDLHEAAGGQTVAFGCQSGTSRSGAVAQLYYQRQLAEKLFKAGRSPSAEELTRLAKDWGATCKSVRANQFAERMPAGMLEEHAALLADEMGERPMDRPRVPVPTVQPKPMLASPLNLATKPPATPPKPQGGRVEAQAARSGPPVASKPAPHVLPKPLHGTVGLGEQVPPPKPARAKASDSSDSESLFSGVSGLSANSDSTFGSGIGAARPTPAPRKATPLEPAKPTAPAAALRAAKPETETEFTALYEKHKAAARPSHPYGVGVTLTPLPPAAPPPSEFYSVASAGPQAAQESVYSDIDDTYAQIRTGPSAARAADTPEVARFQLQARQSIRRMRETGMAAFNRAVEIPIGTDPMGATSERLQAWQRGQHERSADLVKFLDCAGKTFAADARQGFRPWAGKDSYGLGLTLKTLREQAYSPVWAELAQALEQTLDEAPPSKAGMTDDILTMVLKDRLKAQYAQLDSRQKETWLRRTDKKEFKEALDTLRDELNELTAQVNQGHQDHAVLASQLRGANLRLLTLKALYHVGTDPAQRR
ncbi:hypothetical protein [Roseateles terrae]|uniref:Tyrosine specific protein phosphatases domain-containing protein n=1 Tax=Roseateles terrae TaxID=431060 RepID=A0ABR6GXK2_9BURK|nr:hypothetical protein [Roseateles terrae]MBB3196833.1 hypothetical protein [Roseateles terrae]OWQ84606.1 hypothetical protein CDN98_19100 [Roseateles terrae]